MLKFMSACFPPLEVSKKAAMSAPNNLSTLSTCASLSGMSVRRDRLLIEHLLQSSAFTDRQSVLFQPVSHSFANRD